MDEFEMRVGEGRRKLAPLHLLMKSNPSSSISHKSAGKSQGLRESDSMRETLLLRYKLNGHGPREQWRRRLSLWLYVSPWNLHGEEVTKCPAALLFKELQFIAVLLRHPCMAGQGWLPSFLPICMVWSELFYSLCAKWVGHRAWFMRSLLGLCSIYVLTLCPFPPQIRISLSLWLLIMVFKFDIKNTFI